MRRILFVSGGRGSEARRYDLDLQWLDEAALSPVDTNETGTITTHYVAGGSYEVVTSGATITRKLATGLAVIIDTSTTPGAWTSQTQDLLTDHLDSVYVVTDAAGAVAERAG